MEDEFSNGMAAVERGDYLEAYQLLKPFAEKGSAEAQYQIGVMYHRGQGVLQEYPKAVYWYQKAADQDHTDAQIILSFMYSGKETANMGIPYDPEKGLSLLYKGLNLAKLSPAAT